MTEELSEGRAVIVRGEHYVCTDILRTLADSDDFIIVQLRKINEEEAKE